MSHNVPPRLPIADEFDPGKLPLLQPIVEDAMRRVLTERGEHLDAYIRAYLRETGTPITELELCEQHDRDGTIRWFFRQRQPPP